MLGLLPVVCCFGAYRRVAGYVEQQDIHSALVTVKEVNKTTKKTPVSPNF